MTVLTPVRVPRQAGPVEPPAAPPRPAGLLPDERMCLLGLLAMALVLGTVIVGGLLISTYVWS